VTVCLRRGLGMALAVLCACGVPHLLTVPNSPAPANAQALRVDYPPPPAKVEEIPISHGTKGACLWRDGYWDWTGRRWEWQPGRAVLAPAGCLFAEAKLEWSTDSLSFYRPAWYPDPARTPAPKACTEVACIPSGATSGTEPASPEATSP